jgi:hypothetical protein
MRTCATRSCPAETEKRFEMELIDPDAGEVMPREPDHSFLGGSRARGRRPGGGENSIVRSRL